MIKLTSLVTLMLMLLNLVWMPGSAEAQAVVIQPPTFSHPRGFYSSTFNLTLSSPSGGTIYYTTNGDSPVSFTSAAPAQDAIQYNGGNIQINGTRVVRAAVISGGNKSAVVTHTYLFLAQVRNQPDTAPAGMPENAKLKFAADDPKVGTFPSDFGMDPEVLNHPNYSAPGKFESIMKSLPTLSLVTDLENMWHPDYGIQWNSNAKEGHEDYPLGDPFNNPVSPGKWERPVSLEWINPDGTTGFQQDGGMRMHGQASRRPKRTPKKSIRIYFKKGYGIGNLDFQLFSDATAVSKFDRLILRNGGNRSWPYFDRDQRRETDYVNDEWARQAWQEMGHLAPHGTYVHLYINGLYWGLYNVAERIDEKYLAAYTGLAETDFDLIESEEEQDDNSVASVGDMTAYNSVMGLISPGSTTPLSNATYNQLKTLVDMNSLADYFIHVHYIGKTDWPDHNYNLYRARVGADTRFKFIAWDNDSGLNKVNQNTTLMTETMTYPHIMGPDGQTVPDTSKPLMYDAPVQIFYRLTTNPEFRQLVTDRFYKHVVDPTGTLAPARCAQIYTELTGLVDQAVIAESARWGDYSRDKYPPTNFVDVFDKPFPAYLHSRDLPNSFTDPTNAVLEENQKTWVQVRSEKLNTYCPNRSNIVLSQYQANGWYVAPLNVPGISQRGGLLPANNTITLNNTANGGTGDIYYTTNGVDPRVEFGAVAAGATKAAGAGADSATIVMPRATTLKARVYNSANNTWSPLLEYVFAPNQPMQNLVVNEIHYIPTVPTATLDAKQYEFIELYNSGQVPLQLDRVAFSRGITYQFPADTTIQPGQYFVLASNPGIFQGRYGFAPYGTYTGSLANEGEPVELVDAVGNSIERVDFKPLAPWPVLGITGPNAGKSLSLFSPTVDNKLAASWRASLAVNGTPGQPNGHVAQGKQVPTLLVSKPAPITYGQPLTANQFEVAMSGPPGVQNGTLSYNPPLGTVMQAGYGQQISVTFTPNDTNTYAPATATTSIDVLRAPLTITADSKVWQTTTAFPTLTATYSGFVNGDTEAVLDAPPILSTTATENSPIGNYPISVSGASDNNYNITFVDGTFVATDKAIPVVTITGANLTYGQPLRTDLLNASATHFGSTVPGSLSYSPPLGTVLPAGEHTLSITFTPNDTGSFSPVTKNVNVNVAKAPLVIQADNKIKQVGTANPTLTVTYSGFVNGDSAASLDAPVTLNTTATTASAVGTYPITVGGAADANYNITFVNGTLTVTTEPVSQLLMLPMVVGAPR